jgi:hypothetical protein
MVGTPRRLTGNGEPIAGHIWFLMIVSFLAP